MSSAFIKTSIDLLFLATPCDADGLDLEDPTAPPPPRPTPSPNDYTPFTSRAEFQLAEFLYKKAEMSAGLVNELMEILASYFAAYDDDPPFEGHSDLLKTIDGITLGTVPWESFTGRYNGPLPTDGPIPEWMTTDYEVHYRDIHELVRQMIANPDFKDEFDYTPYQEFENEKRRWSDFMSGNWAWRQAVSYSFLF